MDIIFGVSSLTNGPSRENIQTSNENISHEIRLNLCSSEKTTIRFEVSEVTVFALIISQIVRVRGEYKFIHLLIVFHLLIVIYLIK